ncbi:hypothetical protein Tco_0881676, partial [Tanacetum coccineum]
NVPHHGIDLWLKVQIFYDHVNPATRHTIDQSADGKLRDKNAKESWALIDDLALYDNESWNDPRDFIKPVKAISLPHDVPNASYRHLVELEINSLHDTQYCMKNPKKAFVDYASSCTDEAGDITDESANETDDVDESDMVLSDDNPAGDDDVAGYEVFMHNNSTATPNATYLSLTVTSVLATKTLLQEMFPDKNTHHLSSPPATKMSYPITYPQPSSLQAKAKKLMRKAKQNMRKINFKKVVTQKFREYDQKLEALTNFNVFEAFEKAVQAKVLTEMKKLLPNHIPKAVANYVRPRINTSVLNVMKNNQINLFTQSSNSNDNLSEMDLKLKLLNRIHLNKLNETHTTHQQLYDTLYESITLDQDALNTQDAEPSFHNRSSRRNKSPVIHAQVETPAIQPLDQEDEYDRNHPNPRWFLKKSGPANDKRRTT